MFLDLVSLYIVKSLTRDVIRFLGLRKYTVKAVKSESLGTTSCKFFGQPTPESHPHLLSEGEITPLITKSEYQSRRDKLVEKILNYAQKNCAEKKHVVCICFIK